MDSDLPFLSKERYNCILYVVTNLQKRIVYICKNFSGNPLVKLIVQKAVPHVKIEISVSICIIYALQTVMSLFYHSLFSKQRMRKQSLVSKINFLTCFGSENESSSHYQQPVLRGRSSD